MPTTYLLPCQCGKKSQVDSSQAGLSVRCECGAELAVPTMRGLSGLERVDTARQAPSPTEPAWGARQGLIFLGSTIVIIAAVAAAGIWWVFMPTPPTLRETYQEEIRSDIDQQSLEDLMQRWQQLRVGIEAPSAEAMITNYEAMVSYIWTWEAVIGGFGAIGLLLIIIGVFKRPPGRVMNT